jgi:cytochrome d ubiquinol oxidase subunit II
MTIQTLQAYWWLLISVLGALLVFLLFVQGGQSMLTCFKNKEYRSLVVNSLGRKWEFTFTTLVVFGGGFFASFPLFYSTSFGGAYWLWMLILFSFVVQAVSYEFRSKKGNIYGTCTYDAFLFFNGLVGCVLLGVAVGMMFFGAEFTVTKANIVNPGSPIISQWSDTHGLEAIACWKNLLLGFAVFFLARTQGALYLVNNLSDGEELNRKLRRHVLVNGLIFAVLFVSFVVVLFLADGYRQEANGMMERVDNIYLLNMIDMWWTIPMFVIGVLAVLYGIFRTSFTTKWRCGIWYSGIGTVLVVLVLFFLAGYNNTAYYPSLLDPRSSLTLANSSASEFTLTVMSVVSILVPFVLAYIVVVWRKLTDKPLTPQELNESSHKY